MVCCDEACLAGASFQAFLGGSAQVLAGFPTSLEKWCPSRVLSSSSNVRRDGRDSSGALWAALGLPLGLVGEKHPSV